MDDLGLEQADHRFGERVIVGISELPTEGSIPALASRSLYLIDEQFYTDATRPSGLA
jgi:hypothetical protein